MRKIIAAINLTLDGYCDHTAVVADDDLHRHYKELIQGGGVALYGRVTYHLMEYWRTVIENPTGNKETDEFAKAMDAIQKIVFSRTLKTVDWKTARLATRSLEEEVLALKQQSGKDIYACSPSIIVQLTNLGLIDEYQLCIHPVIAGGGLPLFKDVSGKQLRRIEKTKSLSSGAIVMYYEPSEKG